MFICSTSFSLFGLEGVDSTVFHIGGINTGLGILAVDIEGPVFAVFVPIQGNAIDFIHIQTVIGSMTIDQTLFNQSFANPDYILREQGAVLNWFDITEIEGRFSLNDKIGEVIKTFRGKLWFAGLFLILARKMSQGTPKVKSDGKKKKKGKNPDMNADVMNMIGGFTVLRFTGMLGMRNVSFTKEELLKMNAQLNKIKKPKSQRSILV